MAFNGGTIAALVVVALAVLGICIMHLMFEMMYGGPEGLNNNDVPMLMVNEFLVALVILFNFYRINGQLGCQVGYGFGASFVALFAQLGGGIFTKVGSHALFLSICKIDNHFTNSAMFSPSGG